jgi:hypothetical protein
MKRQAEAEIFEAREMALQQKQRVLEELQQALARGEVRTQEQISALREAFASKLDATAQSLSLKVEQIQSRLPSAVVPSASGLYLLSGVDPSPLKFDNPFFKIPDSTITVFGGPEKHKMFPSSPVVGSPVSTKSSPQAEESSQLKKDVDKPPK